MAKRQNTTPTLHIATDNEFPEIPDIDTVEVYDAAVPALPASRDYTPLITGAVVGLTAIGLALASCPDCQHFLHCLFRLRLYRGGVHHPGRNY
jgi:hypothetical protein